MVHLMYVDVLTRHGSLAFLDFSNTRVKIGRIISLDPSLRSLAFLRNLPWFQRSIRSFLLSHIEVIGTVDIQYNPVALIGSYSSVVLLRSQSVSFWIQFCLSLEYSCGGGSLIL